MLQRFFDWLFRVNDKKEQKIQAKFNRIERHNARENANKLYSSPRNPKPAHSAAPNPSLNNSSPVTYDRTSDVLMASAIINSSYDSSYDSSSSSCSYDSSSSSSCDSSSSW